MSLWFCIRTEIQLQGHFSAPLSVKLISFLSQGHSSSISRYRYLEFQVLSMNWETVSQETDFEKYHQFQHNQYFFLREL